MKRALAERAKGDALTPVVAVSSGGGVSSSGPGSVQASSIQDSGVRLPKAQRFHLPLQSEENVSQTLSFQVPSSSNHSTGLGGVVNTTEENVVAAPVKSALPPLPLAIPGPFSLPTNNGLTGADPVDRSYYLQYQNRALLAEMYRLKHMVSELEDERLARRTQCDMARQCVDVIQAVWSSLEHNVALKSLEVTDKMNSTGTNHATTDATTSSSSVNDQVSSALSFFSSNQPSTGEGTNVESISSLLSSISRLASTSPVSPKMQGNPWSSKSSVEEKVNALSNTRHDPSLALGTSRNHIVDPKSTNSQSSSAVAMNIQVTLTGIQHRVSTLLSQIVKLLEHVNDSSTAKTTKSSTDDPTTAPMDDSSQSSLVASTSQLQDRINACESQILELSASRDDALKKERRVRRYLFRILAGQPADEVLRDVELESDDIPYVDFGTSSHHQTGLVVVSQDSASSKMLNGPSEKGATVSRAAAAALSHGSAPSSDLSKVVVSSSEDSDRYTQRLTDLESRCEARQTEIDELMRERKELQARITELLVKRKGRSGEGNNIVGDGDENGGGENVDASECMSNGESDQETIKELKRQLQKAEMDVDEWRNRVAIYKGQKEAIQKGMNEQYSNFVRRWKEFQSESSSSDNTHSSSSAFTPTLQGIKEGGGSGGGGRQEAHISLLEHKLHQALEGARRAETFKRNLSEASSVIECLQRQIEEWSEKYQALLSAQQSQTSSSSTGTNTNSGSSTSEGGAATAAAVNEKLMKDNKKMKVKIDQLRSERDIMNKTNHRLLQQSTEKEEINAEALSTILQLRQRIDLHAKEKDESDKKFKAAQQLALAARLAATAKERVDEESSKEKELLEKNLLDREADEKVLKEQISSMERQVKQTEEQVEFAKRDFEAAKQRCDELTEENNNVTKEKSRALEDLKVTTKRMIELRRSASRGGVGTGGSSQIGGGDNDNSSSLSGSGTTSQFTSKQLTTQLEVLKGRLTCPVCNNRDKSCILSRCRHMFCRVCVDTNIKNRSRKCPACGVRFDTKDVAEIWL